ncbi:MAG: SPOR domain-containing protein [Bacteroidales bacterium]|nr:SPOR domain-containing protein [Bacteroidales bacterium]
MRTAFGFFQVLLLWGFFCVLTPGRTYAQSAAGADTAFYPSLSDADSTLNVLPDSLATAPDTVLPLGDILRRITHDKALDSLIQKRLAYYKDHPTQGYSVLFFSASGNHSGAAAEQANELFQFLYPETPTYLSYDAPYYKLKAGNFRTRLEASAFLAKIQNDYPNAFVVRDVLDIKHLLQMEEPEPEPENPDGDTEDTDAAPVE